MAIGCPKTGSSALYFGTVPVGNSVAVPPAKTRAMVGFILQILDY
jgi:hypothetical protein